VIGVKLKTIFAENAIFWAILIKSDNLNTKKKESETEVSLFFLTLTMLVS